MTKAKSTTSTPTTSTPTTSTHPAPAPAANPVVPGELPARLRLTAPHGYVRDDGSLYLRVAGHVVEDPEEVALLLARGALVEVA